MKKTSLVGLGAVLTAVCMTGCGGSGSGPTGSTTGNVSPSLLELPNGGQTTSNETANFGDTATAAVPDTATTGADSTLASDGTLAPVDPVPAARRHVYRAFLIWGFLPHANDAETGAAPTPTATDWTGSVSIPNGALSVRRTILFDGGDHVNARTAPDAVSFVSHTLPSVDGLELTLRTDGPAQPLHMATAAYTGDFPLPDADGDVHYLADGHTGVYYVAFEDGASACLQGTLVGHWRRLDANFGDFHGRVYDNLGDQRGAIRGVWGHNRAGAGVFFGKHIDNAGVFNGLLGGTYTEGHFAGDWDVVSGRHGDFHGRYFDGGADPEHRGLFLGRWRSASCQ